MKGEGMCIRMSGGRGAERAGNLGKCCGEVGEGARGPPQNFTLWPPPPKTSEGSSSTHMHRVATPIAQRHSACQPLSPTCGPTGLLFVPFEKNAKYTFHEMQKSSCIFGGSESSMSRTEVVPMLGMCDSASLELEYCSYPPKPTLLGASLPFQNGHSPIFPTLFTS